MLGDKVATPSRDDLIEASQVLNHAIFLRYKTFQHRAMNELEKKCGFNAEGKSGVYSISVIPRRKTM